MHRNKAEMKLRSCYGKDGKKIEKNVKPAEFVPLSEILGMFAGLRTSDNSPPLGKTG